MGGCKLIFSRTFLVGVVCIAATLGPLGASALGETGKGCKEPETGAKETPIFSPPLSSVVVGAGRLQFYSAPDLRCPMAGVFVIGGDELIAYAETRDGWTSVMYTSPRTGRSVSGWVRSTRLKATGTVGPNH